MTATVAAQLAALREVLARAPHTHTRPMSDDEVAHEMTQEHHAEEAKFDRMRGSDADSDRAAGRWQDAGERSWWA
jgi:hypothetical protein